MYIQAIVYDFVFELWRNPKEKWRNDKGQFCYYGWIILQKQFSQSYEIFTGQRNWHKKAEQFFKISIILW